MTSNQPIVLIVERKIIQDVRDWLRENADSRYTVLSYQGKGASLPQKGDAYIRNEGVSEVVFVGLGPKSVKKIARNYQIAVKERIATVRGGEAALRTIFCLSTPVKRTVVLPSIAFQNAAMKESQLLLATNALNNADRIHTDRHEFTNRAADALRDYAVQLERKGTNIVIYFKERQLQFASSGRTTLKYTVYRSGKVIKSSETKWHLKEGDATSQELAARVYFDNIEGYVAVLYVGPHPKDISVRLDLPPRKGE